MEIKNVNLGALDSKGGNIHVGDVINGIPYLDKEFKDQLKVIEFLLESFQPKTALTILRELKTRVENSDLPSKNLILSKILFLDSLCMDDIPEYSVNSVSKGFIAAYNSNKEDKEIRNHACIEYLNLNEYQKAVKIADEILKTDEFSIYAWFVKIFTSDDIKEALDDVPKTVKEDYFFRQSITYQLIRFSKLGKLEDFKKYDLSLDVDIEKYKELNYRNRKGWLIAIDLLINKFFAHYPIRLIVGDESLFYENQTVEDSFILLEKYIDTLKDTEIKESVYHQEFYYNYLKFFSTKDVMYLNQIDKVYSKLNVDWFYTFTYCQVINFTGDYQRSLTVLEEYGTKNKEKTSEFYIFKAVTLELLGKSTELPKLLNEYLDITPIINESVGFNLINTFLIILRRELDDKQFDEHLNQIIEKEFNSFELKLIFEITVKIRYKEKPDVDELYNKLNELIRGNSFDVNYKNLICENLVNIGKIQDAIDYMETYLDLTVISPTLEIYIKILEKKLYQNTEAGTGVYKILLENLKFWRLNSKVPKLTFLRLEHNLNNERNCLEELLEIDKLIYHSFPDDEQHLLLYLNTLIRLNMVDSIIPLIADIPDYFDSEDIGLKISSLLLSVEEAKDKGAQLLFNLASIKSNSEARKYYFINSNNFKKDFCKNFEIVELTYWVIYSVNDIEQPSVQVLKNKGFEGKLLGKKVGETFTEENTLNKRFNTIKILRICNDGLNLHVDIQNEMKNPVNNLGFLSLQLPKKPEDFEKFLREEFGVQGAADKNAKHNLLNDYNNYKIGFTEVSNSVFQGSFIDAYLYFTNSKEHVFTTIPNLATKDNKKDENIKFALDFTSLFMFYDLDKKLGFKFNHKFVISYLVKAHIELKIIEEKNSPESALSVNISTDKIERFRTPDNYKEKRIEFFQSIIDWIDLNCEIDTIDEKLDITLNENFKNKGERFDTFMKVFIDSMFLSMRENTRLITSDSSLYLFQNDRNLAFNLLNPEKFLKCHYNDKFNVDFFRFLLSLNYVGISINEDVLKREFYDFIVGKENYYTQCLNNIRYTIHGDPKIIEVGASFLRSLYLMQAIPMESKNRFALEFLKFLLYGMPKEVENKLYILVKERFKLLGSSLDEIVKTFLIAKKMFGLN